MKSKALKWKHVIGKCTAITREGRRERVFFLLPSLALAREMLAWVTALRREAQWLGQWKKETPASVKKFIHKHVQAMREKKGLQVVAATETEIIGNATISPALPEAKQHVGVFGIGLLKEFGGMGIGYRLGKTVLELARKKTTLKLIESACNARNAASMALHKKLGFGVAGKIPQGLREKSGAYGDEVLFYQKIRRGTG